MKDLPIVFARLWGWHEAKAYAADNEIWEVLMHYDSIDLYHMFNEWAEEFMQDDSQDPTYFFEDKMKEVYAKYEEEK